MNIQIVVFVSWVYLETSKDHFKHFEATGAQAKRGEAKGSYSLSPVQVRNRVNEFKTEKGNRWRQFNNLVIVLKLVQKVGDECWLNPQIWVNVFHNGTFYDRKEINFSLF